MKTQLTLGLGNSNTNSLPALGFGKISPSKSNFCCISPVIINNVVFDTICYVQLSESFFFHKVVHTT